jgi:membrane fusion protein (multidrug efflux system)
MFVKHIQEWKFICEFHSTKILKNLLMKTKIFSIALAIIVLASCGADKQAQLNKLRKQHDQLSEQIKKLEGELANTDSSSTNKGTRVAITELKPSTFNHFIEVQGKVDGDENVAVSCQTGGIIDQILVKEGQQVYKGQVLAKLDDKVLQQNLKDLQSGYEFANNMYEKQKALWDQKIGSEVQYLTAKNTKESLENKINTLKDQIELMYLKSPINGTIEDMPVKVGQLIGPGLPAFRVVNFSKIKVVAEIAEAYTSRISDGDMVSVFFPDLKKEVIGKVDFSSKFINPTNRTFSINVRLNGVDKNIKANMIAILKVNDYKAVNSLIVPINVIQTDLTGSYVAIAVKSTTGFSVKKVPVNVGETYKGLTEVKSGLNSGDLIITTGYMELENGQAINF